MGVWVGGLLANGFGGEWFCSTNGFVPLVPLVPLPGGVRVTGFGGFGGWWESLPQWVELTALAGSEPWRCLLVNRELFCWKAGW